MNNAAKMFEDVGFTPQQAAVLSDWAVGTAATKADLAEEKSVLRAEIAATRADLKDDIHALDRKIEKVDNKIDRQGVRMETEFKYLKWIGGGIFALLLPLFAATVQFFLTHGVLGD